MLSLHRKSPTAPPPPETVILTAAERDRYQRIVVKESFGSRVFFGLVGSAVVAIIMNFVGLKWIIIHLFALVLSFFGRDAYDVTPKEAAQKAVAGAGSWVAGKAHLPRLGGKTPEQVEAERKSARAKLVAEADALGLSWREDWPNEKLEVEIREGKKRKEEAEKAAREAERERKRQEAREEAAREKEREAQERRRAQEAKEAGERAELVARATAVGLGVNATLPLRELRRQVEEKEAAVAADEAFQRKHRQWEQAMAAYNERVDNGKNAVCPRCGMWMHISPTAKGITAVMCKACKLVTSRDVFRAGFNPPPPPVEPLPPGGASGGFLSGLTGGFQ